VMETNALAGADTISIPAGTYNMVLGNTGEDLAAEGDLDILDDLAITGADPATTILSGNTNQFRVLSVLKRADNTLPVVSISDVSLAQGIAGANGAVLYNEGELTLENVTIDNASLDTAPVYNYYGNLSINNSRITNNAGGIYSRYGNLSVNNSSFSSNATNGGGGGAIYNDSGQLTIDNTQFNGNTSGGRGGGIGRGGAIYSYSGSGSNGTIIDTSITNNTAADGGGIYAHNGTVILKRITLTGNQAITRDGGGAVLGGYGIAVSDSIINGNSAANMGGGLVLRGSATSVHHTEISGNSAAFGGGIRTAGNHVQLENVTISGNSASVDGGGLYHNVIYTTDAILLTHVTLSANTSPAGMGGNIANARGIVLLSNTLIANSGSGSNCTGTITTLGYNLDSSNTCGLGAEGDQPSTDPLLDVLANNGGSTKTH